MIGSVVGTEIEIVVEIYGGVKILELANISLVLEDCQDRLSTSIHIRVLCSFFYLKIILFYMKNYKQEELDIINTQLLASVIFFIAVGISIALTYNRRLGLLGFPQFWTDEESVNLGNWGRILAFIAISLTVYVAVKANELARKKQASKNDIQAADEEVVASLFALIASLIILHANSIADDKNELINIENPEI